MSSASFDNERKSISSLEARKKSLEIKKKLIRKEEQALERQEKQKIQRDKQKQKSQEDAKEEALLKKWTLRKPIVVFFSRRYPSGIWTSDGWSFYTAQRTSFKPISRDILLKEYPSRYGQYGWTCPEGFQGVIDFFISRAKYLDKIDQMTPEEQVGVLIGKSMQMLQDHSKELDGLLNTNFSSTTMTTLIKEYKSQCLTKLSANQVRDRLFQEKPDFNPLQYRYWAVPN